MLRLPNFFLIVFVKPVDWRFPLVLAVPLFLVDELLEICETVFYLFRHRQGLGRYVRYARRVWHSTRRAGAFTLVHVEAEGVRISVRLV